jgi:hypothetical protein
MDTPVVRQSSVHLFSASQGRVKEPTDLITPRAAEGTERTEFFTTEERSQTEERTENTILQG